MQYLLAFSGVGEDRLRLRWVSAAEGQLFARYVKEYSDDIRNAGPFRREEFEMSLNALERALATSRLRWLMGTELQVTEKGNVYGEVLSEDVYQKVLRETAQAEYQKALVFEAMKQGARTMRDIAFVTGLGVYEVSCRMNELERTQQAAFQGYEGKTPLFALSAP